MFPDQGLTNAPELRGPSGAGSTARITTVGALARHSQALPAIAVGALAFGALALGAFAIGRLAIGSLLMGRARVRTLEIEDLDVKRLRVREFEIVDENGLSRQNWPTSRANPASHGR
jgi:hypothetical protein